MSILDDLSISRKQARSIALANADASKSQMNCGTAPSDPARPSGRW
ncbi:hypothetical protein GS481_02425 [Rhodococcus hoagii]|nr:hypothetical protein [Prescottella equi]